MLTTPRSSREPASRILYAAARMAPHARHATIMTSRSLCRCSMPVLIDEVAGGHDPEERVDRRVAVGVECVLVDFPLEGGAQILEYDGVKVVAHRVECRGQDAEVGIDAAHDHGVDTDCAKGLVEVRLKEPAESPFREDDVLRL